MRREIYILFSSILKGHNADKICIHYQYEKKVLNNQRLKLYFISCNPINSYYIQSTTIYFHSVYYKINLKKISKIKYILKIFMKLFTQISWSLTLFEKLENNSNTYTLNHFSLYLFQLLFIFSYVKKLTYDVLKNYEIFANSTYFNLIFLKSDLNYTIHHVYLKYIIFYLFQEI